MPVHPEIDNPTLPMNDDFDYAIETNPESRVITVSFSGNITLPAAQGAMKHIGIAAEKDSCDLFLYDARMATLEMSTTELYYLPSTLKAPISRKLAALIDDNVMDADWRFLSTVLKNAGRNVRYFNTKEAALDWLAKS